MEGYHLLEKPADSKGVPAELATTANNNDSVSKEKDVETEVETYTTYKRRWYILFIFSAASFTYGVAAQTWGPMTYSAEFAFYWTRSDLAMLIMWNFIMQFVATPFFAWLLTARGVRAGAILAAILLTGGTLVRSFTSTPPGVTVLVHIGQALIGTSGAFFKTTPPLLSSLWFPPEQRTTSTAVCQASYSLGLMSSIIMVPLFVHDYSNHPRNQINDIDQNTTFAQFDNITTNTYLLVLKQRQEIMKIVYGEFGLALFFTIAILVYFPGKPPKPPSASGGADRMGFKQGLLEIVRNGQFWIICLTFALTQGVIGGYESVANIILRPVGYSQNHVDILAYCAGVSALVLIFVVARFADILYKHMKTTILVLFSVSAVSTLFVSFSLMRVIPVHILTLDIPAVLIVSCVTATIPIFYEMACEYAYPVSESVSNGLMTWCVHPFAILFLAILTNPNVGTLWMTWTLFCGIVLGGFALFFFKASYNKRETDEAGAK